MAKKRGRPPLPKDEVRSAHLSVRLTQEELEALEVAADQAGKEPSVFVREAALAYGKAKPKPRRKRRKEQQP